jgi:predicted RNase H-like nuclease (RuvC/YqgF family)
MLAMSQTTKKVKKKRRKKSKVYFGTPVQEAIIRYNESSNPAEKNRIYSEEIHAAFCKMAENLIHTFKFYYFDYPFEEVKNEVVSFLVMQMPKYEPSKGRAFSYFSVVGKNYLILNNNNNYKKMKIHDEITKLDYKRNVSSEEVNEEVNEFNSEFVIQMLEYWDNNITNIFNRQKDILVADSVLELFRRRQNIENFNKKALYIMIREMTGSNTQHITRVINQMKKYYFNMIEEFSAYGEVDTSNTGSIF